LKSQQKTKRLLPETWSIHHVPNYRKTANKTSTARSLGSASNYRSALLQIKNRSTDIRLPINQIEINPGNPFVVPYTQPQAA
jgi:hypothetical protein